MYRNQTTQTQRTSTVRNANRNMCGGISTFLIASGLILVTSLATAGESPYFGRQSAAYGRRPGAAAWNIQRQAIDRVNAVRHVADSRAAQTRIRQQLGRSWFATPRVNVQLGQPTPPDVRLQSPGHGVIRIHELGFDAVAQYHDGRPQGLQVVRVAWQGVAADIGLEPGYVILQLNGYSVHDSQGVRQMLRNTYGGELQFVIRDVRTGRTDVRNAQLHQ